MSCKLMHMNRYYRRKTEIINSPPSMTDITAMWMDSWMDLEKLYSQDINAGKKEKARKVIKFFLHGHSEISGVYPNLPKYQEYIRNIRTLFYIRSISRLSGISGLVATLSFFTASHRGAVVKGVKHISTNL